MNVVIDDSWKKVLGDYFKTPHFKALTEQVKQEYLTKTVFSHPKNLFNAFNVTPFDKVSVVILGQDPYHGVGQAHGLSFSVEDGVTAPPSLKNILKECADDIGHAPSVTNDLTLWANQGVLLLNSVLTVEAAQAASHAKLGWQEFTDYVIKTISDKKEHCVFILWGNYAKAKSELIDTTKHLIITSPHPSPFSAHSGFFGSKPFSRTNMYLAKHNKTIITW